AWTAGCAPWTERRSEMGLLGILTLLYAGILVLALAISLVTIWVYLLRIAGSLRGVCACLEQARDATEPLNERMERFHEDCVAGEPELTEATDRLIRAVQGDQAESVEERADLLTQYH
ncbi:MAG: hypothetical protein KY468_09685, partial [Armatimonadetes bacterium]|nr:hypothetical protein [Armatimonadota bacterium]